MAVGDVVQAVQRVGDLAGLPQQRTGRLVGQVEITAAQLVLVELQVGCEEQNGAAGDGEIEHRRGIVGDERSEEHTSELQSRENLVCRLLLEKKKNKRKI